MCARRFLMLIFILILIFVGGALALYQWGGEMLLKSATPRGHFVAAEAGSGPDYAKADSWIARPDIKGNPSTWAPERYLNVPANAANYMGQLPPPVRAAAFYIHPTTYLERDGWNAPLNDKVSQDRAVLFVRSQASVFNDVADVWAPKYRQAAYGAFLLKSEDAHKALNLAYGDVARAFDEFLRRNPDGPIILAAHSQGSLHLLRLLAERKGQLQERLVAAYVVGWPVGVRSDLPATGLGACTRQDEAGCLLSWQSFAEPANMSLITDAWVGTEGLTGAERRRDEMLCVNPVTGVKDGVSIPDDNPGTLVPTADLSDASLAEGQVGSRCDKGFLLIDGQIPALGPYVLPGNNYHVYDYALFWGSIRADAERRLAAWRAR
jgi:hypothetical protein